MSLERGINLGTRALPLCLKPLKEKPKLCKVILKVVHGLTPTWPSTFFFILLSFAVWVPAILICFLVPRIYLASIHNLAFAHAILYFAMVSFTSTSPSRVFISGQHLFPTSLPQSHPHYRFSQHMFLCAEAHISVAGFAFAVWLFHNQLYLHLEELLHEDKAVPMFCSPLNS